MTTITDSLIQNGSFVDLLFTQKSSVSDRNKNIYWKLFCYSQLILDKHKLIFVVENENTFRQF
jgi:hypothetical protein